MSVLPATAVVLSTDLKMVGSCPSNGKSAVSTFGAGNGTLFTAGRASYAAGREGHMPSILAMAHAGLGFAKLYTKQSVRFVNPGWPAATNTL